MEMNSHKYTLDTTNIAGGDEYLGIGNRCIRSNVEVSARCDLHVKELFSLVATKAQIPCMVKALLDDLRNSLPIWEKLIVKLESHLELPKIGYCQSQQQGFVDAVGFLSGFHRQLRGIDRQGRLRRYEHAIGVEVSPSEFDDVLVEITTTIEKCLTECEACAFRALRQEDIAKDITAIKTEFTALVTNLP